MKTQLRVWRLGLFAVLAAGVAPAGRAEDLVTQPIQQKNSVEAVIPSQLTSLLLDNPTVTFWITVNEEGKLVDHLAKAAIHHELLARAEETLAQLEFAPALDKGKPVQSSGEVTIKFFDPEQRAVRNGMVSRPFGSSAMESTSRKIYEGARDHYVYRRAAMDELDQPVTLQETKVLVLTDAAGKPAAGECVVDFYIDPKGKVRMPRIVKSDNETVALSALLTLQQSQYAPVSRSGIPAYVKVRLPMSYAPPAETSAVEK